MSVDSMAPPTPTEAQREAARHAKAVCDAFRADLRDLGEYCAMRALELRIAAGVASAVAAQAEEAATSACPGVLYVRVGDTSHYREAHLTRASAQEAVDLWAPRAGVRGGIVYTIVEYVPRSTVASAVAERAEEVRSLKARVVELTKQFNTPELHDFSKAVVLEAAHQRARWGSEYDAGKEHQDWYWLLGYLSGKALRAHADGDVGKALHHTISSAAVLANWHAALSGHPTRMRPGIDGDAALAWQGRVEDFLTPSGEAAEQLGEAAVDPSEGKSGDAPTTTGGEVSASPDRAMAEEVAALREAMSGVARRLRGTGWEMGAVFAEDIDAALAPRGGKKTEGTP